MATGDRSIRPMVDDHIEFLVKKGYKPRINRIGVLIKLANAYAAAGRWPSSLDDVWLSDWFVETFPHLTPNSRRTYATWVREFIRYGADHGAWRRSAAQFDPGKTSSKRSKPPVWVRAEIIRDAWEGQDWYFRGLIAFAALTLARGSEVITLKVGDLISDHRVQLIRHKTDDYDDQLPMFPELTTEMRRYLAAYEQAIRRPLEPDMYLFPRYKWLAVEPYIQRDEIGPSVKRILLDYLPGHIVRDEAKTKGLGGHALRRIFARGLYQRMRELKRTHEEAVSIVQGMLGHASPLQTAEYIGLDVVRGDRDAAVDSMTFFADTKQEPAQPAEGEGLAPVISLFSRKSAG